MSAATVGTAELEADHRRELRKLDDIAFALLNATQNNTLQAERMLDDFVELLFQGGALSMWRYRILLQQIQAGL
jgi:hypothetical protein